MLGRQRVRQKKRVGKPEFWNCGVGNESGCTYTKLRLLRASFVYLIIFLNSYRGAGWKTRMPSNY